MAYATWSVSFGEQPSAAKWNILGTNDASFNDGTGIGTNAIAAASLKTNAIKLGYVEKTTNFQASVTSATQITGLSIAVTIPAGGRSVKITAYCPQFAIDTANNFAHISIWDGTVGSGTQLNKATSAISNVSGHHVALIAIAVVTPSAGAKTYNAGMHTSAGQGTITMAATQPGFVLVEAI